MPIDASAPVSSYWRPLAESEATLLADPDTAAVAGELTALLGEYDVVSAHDESDGVVASWKARVSAVLVSVETFLRPVERQQSSREVSCAGVVDEDDGHEASFDLPPRQVFTAADVVAITATFVASFDIACATLASPASYAQMSALDALLVPFEAHITAWRRTAMVEVPAFQSAVAALWDRADRRNDRELRREALLATLPSAGRMRIDAGREQLGDRDWLQLYVPGVPIERRSLRGRAAVLRGARAPEAITGIVMHLGGVSNAGTIDYFSRPAVALAGHHVVDLEGVVMQMYPVSQIGAHAGVANRTSVAIDLAYGDKVGDSGNLALLGSVKQLVNAARLASAHRRVCPSITDRVSARGVMLGEHLAHAQSFGGGFGGVMSIAGAHRDAVQRSVVGVMAHQHLPDSSHGDPGELYMLRLRALMPALDAYEARYGPVDLGDALELSKVAAMVATYEETTKRAAAGMLQSEVERRHALSPGRTSKDKLEAYNKVYADLVSELARRDPADYRTQIGAALVEINRRVSDAELPFAGSYAEGKLLEQDPRPSPEAYEAAARTYRSGVRSDLASRIVRDRKLVAAVTQDLVDLRAYLTEHLDLLLNDGANA